MKFKKLLGSAVAAAALISIAIPASAAYIAFDDSDVTSITVTAGDFEGGFSVNGSALADGASITLVDGIHQFLGNWIDLGQSGLGGNIFFSLASNPGFVTSGMFFGTSTDGNNGTINGTFGGFQNPSLYQNAPGLHLLQGDTGFASAPFLTMSFKSEQVPEPGTLALVGLGALLIGASRRRAKR